SASDSCAPQTVQMESCKSSYLVLKVIHPFDLPLEIAIELILRFPDRCPRPTPARLKLFKWNLANHHIWF
ncbi:hypothetical protein, partial [Vibrio cholerae]|uniref:hypothetical protein n=1 Tax=Vibrio cholerae TaxID=666 RepID=UPI001C3DBE29